MVEILAPAGNFPCLATAIQYGADSVYFGVGRLNMRAKSSHNFTEDDIDEIVKRCHDAGVKAYLALNTILYDDDIGAAVELLGKAKKAGIDAVIVSDQAAITAASDAGIPVHLSTQLNISNTESLAFYSQWADVAVLARELNLEQTARIAREVKRRPIIGPGGKALRLEVFVHGALCLAQSGKCYLSTHLENKSANRGECHQVCRRSYTITEPDERSALFKDSKTGARRPRSSITVEAEYMMSPKDLCTIGFLDRILEAGVEVLKIEGRARSAEYIRETVSCYREAVDAIADGTYSEEKIAQWQTRLDSVFNRGFWDGYYLGRRTGEWAESYGNAATLEKRYIGKVLNWYPKAGAAAFLVESEGFASDDRLIVIGPTTGTVELDATTLCIDKIPAACAAPGQTISLASNEKLRVNDELYALKPRGL